MKLYGYGSAISLARSSFGIQVEQCWIARAQFPGEILIDQGLADKFLAQELRPELFDEACRKSGQKLLLRRHEGYDHSYYFIASFVDDHLRHHARALLG